MMRTNSNFDTHMLGQSREKYLDKLGIDSSGGLAENNLRAESRRLSRGLSTFDYNQAVLNTQSRES